MKKNFIIIFICIFFSVLSSANASYFEDARTQLGHRVFKQHSVEEIAKKISEIRDYHNWPTDMDPEFKLYVALQWIDKNNMREATELLNGLPVAEVDEDLLKYYRCISLINLKLTRRVVDDLRELEMKHPEDMDVLYLKSLFYAENNQLNEAITTLENLLRKDSRNGKAYLQLGVYHLVAVANDQALKDFERAMKHLPITDVYHRQQATLQAGVLYLRFKFNEKKGNKLIRKGIAMDPNSDLVGQLDQVLR